MMDTEKIHRSDADILCGRPSSYSHTALRLHIFTT